MTNATQLSFPFDMSPCGPVAEAAARRAMLAGIADKVEADDDMGLLGGEDFEADFGDEDDGAQEDEEVYADAAE